MGVNIAEGCPAANMNNALRKAMADVAGGINVSVLGTFLASTTLANARTALGVGAGSTSATNFDALTNTANKVPYMTGSDTWALADFPSFGRSVVACGDAATLNTLLGSLSSPGSSIAAGSGYVKISFAGTVFILQWTDFTASASTNTAVTFPTTYSSWSRAWVNARNTDTDAERNTTVSASTTTGATVTNSYPGSISSTLFSIGV